MTQPPNPAPWSAEGRFHDSKAGTSIFSVCPTHLSARIVTATGQQLLELSQAPVYSKYESPLRPLLFSFLRIPILKGLLVMDPHAIASILKMKKILDEEKQQKNIQSKIEKFENLFNIAHPKMVLPYRHPDWAVEMGSLAHEFDNISSLSTDDDGESRWLHRLAFASLISTGFEAWSCHILPYMLNLRERLLHTAGHSVR
ncbi:hypothetical protein M407DRAFT_19230 [Tulasnella calospora MUT 4182]|uniref:Uncharacterized protein n=1 Tax=Tulasnella calospora MUT 4182 TaxID=1051891 RepID=A0A0C3QTU0_9AGAM|nr:hypothetical protein M407DRAFT_19230 [Tulasnella calospora MUT 4182]